MLVDVGGIWEPVAQRMAAHLDAGRGHLITEDTLRWATIEALSDSGISAQSIAVEHHIPVTNGKLDLVVLEELPVAIEFKFPRDARSGGAADTMTTGELLKDVYRLSTLDSRFGERWSVMLLNDRLCRHLANRRDCQFLFEVGDRLRFEPTGHALLPKTAGGMLREWSSVTTTAACMAALAFGGHRLVAYRVEPVQPAGG